MPGFAQAYMPFYPAAVTPHSANSMSFGISDISLSNDGQAMAVAERGELLDHVPTQNGNDPITGAHSARILTFALTTASTSGNRQWVSDPSTRPTMGHVQWAVPQQHKFWRGRRFRRRIYIISVAIRRIPLVNGEFVAQRRVLQRCAARDHPAYLWHSGYVVCRRQGSQSDGGGERYYCSHKPAQALSSRLRPRHRFDG